MENKKWTVEIEEDPNDPEQLILPLPGEMLEQVGWRDGDTLDWQDNGDGSWTLTKITPTQSE